MAYKYTATVYASIYSSFVCCYGNLAGAVVKKYTEGDPDSCENDYLLREMFLILWAMDGWQQNENGSTTGYSNQITLAQLNDLVNRGKTICGCC